MHWAITVKSTIEDTRKILIPVKAEFEHRFESHSENKSYNQSNEDKTKILHPFNTLSITGFFMQQTVWYYLTENPSSI